MQAELGCKKWDKDLDMKISEAYDRCGVDVKKMVTRIIKHVPPESIDGLEEIRLLGKDPSETGFARYIKDSKIIELYIEDIVCWQPWLLKKSYIFPYLTIGMALGHEIDHHVNRNRKAVGEERMAEKNALKYVYPSMGVFKPIVKALSIFSSKKNGPSPDIRP